MDLRHHGILQAAAIDRGLRADLDVILNDDAAELRNFGVAGAIRRIGKSVLSDAATGMDDHVVADQRMHHGRARADIAMTADANTGADHGRGPDQRSFADFAIRSDHRPRLDDDIRLKPCVGMHMRGRRNAGRAKQRARLGRSRI